MLPENVQQLITRQLKKKGRGVYTPELRSFALTLNFYSTRAYNYVRKTWLKLLPHPSTLRSWYKVVDGRPGFTAEAFKALKLRALTGDIICNLVVDEMAIREQVIYSNDKFYGTVDLGTNFEKESADSLVKATNALVFMAVGINGCWKIPLGYFLIKSLTGSERSNLLIHCLHLLQESNVKVFSLTFDGAATNIGMAKALGAKFDYPDNFEPFFINPASGNKIYVFWDACHMIKLIRNTLGDKKK